jgi:teichuronic acid biosynthesis glycosyltransferase TuaC
MNPPPPSPPSVLAPPMASEARHAPAVQVVRPPAAPAHPRLIRLLTFSTLYPSAASPNHGVFVENRLRHLVASGEATSTVLAPTPWFPSASPRFGAWARHAGAPLREQRHGLDVHHPRFLALPRLGLWTTPASLYATARRALGRMQAEGFDFDVLDGHYLYPDGVVALRLGRHFNKPVVLTARGSDVSQLPGYGVARRAIREAIAGADALIAVSEGLKEGLMALGAAPDRVTVLRNGVDLALFRPVADRAAARAALGLGPGPVMLSVGLLIPRKGHHHVIASLPALQGHTLLILGEGPERAALEAQARALGVADRVRMPGAVPHAALPAHYAAADVMVLASSREGWANVLLEAMACGTPVVASPAWGCREAVRAPEAGLVLDEVTHGAIADGVRRLLHTPPDRAATRRYAEAFGWEETTQGQLDLFRRVLAARC